MSEHMLMLLCDIYREIEALNDVLSGTYDQGNLLLRILILRKYVLKKPLNRHH